MTDSHRESAYAAPGIAEQVSPIPKDVAAMLPPCVVEWGPLSFKDQFKRRWVHVRVNDHCEVLALDHERFRNFLVRRLIAGGFVPSRSLVQHCLTLLGALAEERELPLGNRSTRDKDGALWIDLADPCHRAIRVQPDGWQIVANPPPLFKPIDHQLPLPEPDPAGSFAELFSFLPVLPEEDRLLLLAWAATAWVPMDHPILILHGPPGAAKTTFAAFLRRLIDPSRVELLGPDARADLPLIFDKHALPIFDNVDRLTPQQADLFCQATSGRGIDRRKLYTNNESFILEFKRPALLTSLEVPSGRADFLDRCLILELDRVPPERRRPLLELESEFERARPRLVGALLNLLVGALKARPEVSEEGLSRLADFHRFGRAVATAAGHTPEVFDRAWQLAECRQQRGVLIDRLTQALWLFARRVKSWEGTAEELLRFLNETARDNRIRLTEADGASPVGLGRRLKVLRDPLGRLGVRLGQHRRTDARLIQLEYDDKAGNAAEEAF